MYPPLTTNNHQAPSINALTAPKSSRPDHKLFFILLRREYLVRVQLEESHSSLFDFLVAAVVVYQYIHQQSAHPPGVGRAIIFGCMSMRRYRLQNSLPMHKDYLLSTNQLTCSTLTHMKARGWQHSLLAKWIMNAADKLERHLSLPQAETEKERESE